MNPCSLTHLDLWWPSIQVWHWGHVWEPPFSWYIYIHVCIYNYVLSIYIYVWYLCMIYIYIYIYIYILKDNVNVVAIVAWMCSESTLQTTGHQLARIVNYAFIFHARAWTCDKGHDLRLRFRVQNPQWFWENWCVEWWRILVRNNPNHVRKQ